MIHVLRKKKNKNKQNPNKNNKNPKPTKQTNKITKPPKHLGTFLPLAKPNFRHHYPHCYCHKLHLVSSAEHLSLLSGFPLLPFLITHFLCSSRGVCLLCHGALLLLLWHLCSFSCVSPFFSFLSHCEFLKYAIRGATSFPGGIGYVLWWIHFGAIWNHLCQAVPHFLERPPMKSTLKYQNLATYT